MKKLNNKGFSLVELIIVIAIMAVLIVVLAPQYLKYVEKSRNSTDITNATEIVTALQVYAGDPDADEELPSSDVEITITDAGNYTATDAFVKAALIESGLADSTGVLPTRCLSRSNWNVYQITVEPDGVGGLKFSYQAGTGGTVETTAGTATKAFQNAMAGKKADAD